MTTVTVEEFRKQLDHYLAASSKDDVVLTQDGKPCFLLRSIHAETDDGLATSPEFREMIRQRRREKGIPWEQAKKQLDLG